jgi:hypothetical protein
MVRAILDGSKTQTRRVVKPWAVSDLTHKPVPADLEYLPDFTCYRSTCPYGQPGDRLWVREAFRLVRTVPGGADGDKIPPSMFLDSTRKFEADGSTSLPDGWMRVFGKLRPGIHMPRAASRITLEITGVRVERLQDISEVDALTEGALSVRSPEWDMAHWPDWRREFDVAISAGKKPPVGPSPRETFRRLWESINGPGSWDANPCVWVIGFKRVNGGAT